MDRISLPATGADARMRVCMRRPLYRVTALMLLLPLLSLSFLTLPACADTYTQQGARALLTRFCESYPSLPDGRMYASEAAVYEPEAMPERLAELLYQEENGENALSLCIDYAVYLSDSYTGGEIGIFRGRNRAAAEEIAQMCEERLLRFRRLLPDSPVCKEACVVCYGNVVVLLLLPDNVAARELCDRIF